jgi:hypothetical protein
MSVNTVNRQSIERQLERELDTQQRVSGEVIGGSSLERESRHDPNRITPRDVVALALQCA